MEIHFPHLSISRVRNPKSKNAHLRSFAVIAAFMIAGISVLALLATS